MVYAYLSQITPASTQQLNIHTQQGATFKYASLLPSLDHIVLYSYIHEFDLLPERNGTPRSKKVVLFVISIKVKRLGFASHLWRGFVKVAGNCIKSE